MFGICVVFVWEWVSGVIMMWFGRVRLLRVMGLNSVGMIDNFFMKGGKLLCCV